MARTKTSKAWMHEHLTDAYVRRAQQQGYRSRSAYKLLEILDRDKLVRGGATVVDLGAAPGGWSQVLAARVGQGGAVIALDVLEMAPLAGVTFIRGDFADEATLRRLEEQLGNRPLDLVVSDMAPNISGIGVSDQARSVHLAELALEFACKRLKPGGDLLVKLFQGGGVEAFRKDVAAAFGTVVVRKPKASRDRSSEFYLLARNRRASAGSAVERESD